MTCSFQALVNGLSNAFHLVFLDLDGVLVDNLGAAVRTAGRELVTPGQWAVDFDFDGQPYDWWMANEPTEEIEDCLALLSRDNVKICTARPVGTPGAQAAYDWVHRLAPEFPRKNMILCHDKLLLARPARILVDDADHNIDSFVEAGGYGCLMPRRWNSKADEAERCSKA